jgi:hypothetical protein
MSDRKYADPEAAMIFLLELINAEEPDKGRVNVGGINSSFTRAGGSIEEYAVPRDLAIERGLIQMDRSGLCFLWKQAGMDRFA